LTPFDAQFAGVFLSALSDFAREKNRMSFRITFPLSFSTVLRIASLFWLTE